VNRSTNRLWAATAGLAACGLILTGCGTGQISQTATQESAVNGTSANIGEISLRNVHLQAVQSSDFLQPGTAVQLMFVVGNNSPDVDDELLGVASDIGQVELTGDGAVPARGSLIVGSPDGQDEVMPMGSATASTAEVTLSKPITNGLTYNFTFDFEKAGRTSVAVPISAGEAPRRG
jgi:copper(I)-binding protein